MMLPLYYLGVDGGGTKTVAVIADAAGHIVGASREMVSRILKDLRVGGYLATGGGASS